MKTYWTMLIVLLMVSITVSIWAQKETPIADGVGSAGLVVVDTGKTLVVDMANKAKDLDNWESITTDSLIVLPMPIAKTIRFSLDGDLKGPEAVEIVFPDVDEIRMAGICRELIDGKKDQAQGISEGLETDIDSVARQLVYNDLMIQERAAMARIQSEITTLCELRQKMATLRAMAKEAVAPK